MTTLDRQRGKKNRGETDPEVRWARMIRTAEPPSINPDLGPCIIHLGADNGNGYVQFRYNGKNGYAHRYAWERVHGPIPDGLTVDHLCEVRRCVNIDHLQLAERVENYLRTKLSKTHCAKGHEYTPENTAYKNGRRNCLICRKAASKASGQRRARLVNGLSDRRLRYDQDRVKAVIRRIRFDLTCTIAQGAREIGCNPNYLGRRVWEETRHDVMVRDRGLCQRCGEFATDAHHRKPRGSGGASKPATAFGMANIIALCRGCHSWVESNRAEALGLGLLLTQQQHPDQEAVFTHRGWMLLDDDGSFVIVDGVTP